MRPGNSPSLKPPLKGEHFQQQHQHTHSWGASLNPSILGPAMAIGPGNFGAPLTFFQPGIDPAFLTTHHQAWKSEGGIPAMAYHQQQQPLAGQSAGHYPIEAMFGSQNTYGGYNNSYGNAPYYPPPSNPDQFWGNKQHQQQQQQQNRVNYRNDQAPALANDSLYGYQNDAYPEQSLDGSVNHIETGISGLSIQSKQSDDLGPPSFASIGSRKPTSWASVASQPAKSQPKSLKSKMAASGLTGSTSKHLPPTVTMDALSWESKNGNSAGGKSVPPPAVIAPAAPAIPPQSIVPSSPVEELPSPPIIQTQQTSPPQRPLSNQASGSSWATNGNSSSSGSISTSASSPRPQKESILPPGNAMPRASYNSNNGTSERGMRGPMNYEINENYNPNKYSNQRNHHSQQSNYSKPLLDNPTPYSSARNVGPPTPAARERPESPPVSRGNDGPSDDFSRADMEKLLAENNYNPKEFDLNPRNARFFIIKSYSEDDVHRSIKYSIWCSTDHGNKRLDTAFRNQGDSGPIYLFYSVNRSGHFCGVAQMMSHVDYNASAGVWAQDKWKGQFQVKWIYVKDVPNDELRHITLENNENKPVTNSRDTQEVPYEKGKKVLSIIHNYNHGTSIFDDFLHYELKQEEEQRKPDLPDSPPPVNNYPKMGNSAMPPRDGQMPFRGHPNGNNYSKPRSYPDPRDQRDGGGDYRGEYRNVNDHRGNDYRPERNDYRNDRMDRAPEYGRDHRDHRNMEPHRNEYRERDVHGPRDGGRDYSREYNREPREPPFHRDPYHRDFNAPAGGGGRDYPPRDRNEYRPQEHREFRERADHRERVPHDRSSQQSWRN